jgi:DNA replication protein DnaC
MQLVSVQPINILIQDLQTKITHEIATRSTHHNLSAIVSVKALQDITDRLTKIHKILNIQQYNLVFIGQVGAGKTTAICHLFDLVREVEDTRLNFC